MRNINFDIQNNETDQRFPFKLFYNSNDPSQNHCHTEIEFLYVIENSMTALINGKCTTLNKGELLMIPCGDIHGVQPSSHRRMVIQFKLDILEDKYINGDDLYNIYEKIHSIDRVSSKWPFEIRTKVLNIMKALHEEHNTGDTKGRIRVLGLLHELVYMLSTIPNGTDEYERNPLLQNRKAMYSLQKVFVFIHDNYSKNLTINDISEMLHYSPKYFSRMWTKYIGTPFHKYLNEYRVNQAKQLLKHTPLPVQEISFQVGFQSIKTFNRVFKSVTDMSPSQYREDISKL